MDSNITRTEASSVLQLISNYMENMSDFHSNIRHLILLLEQMYDRELSTRSRSPSNLSPILPDHGYTTPPPSPPPRTSRQFDRAPGTALYSLFPRTIRQHIQGFMEDVVVRPTQLQIDNAVEYFEYDPTGNFIDGRCPISLEDFVEGEQLSRIRHCQHVFKRDVLNDWFSRNVHCPVCRYDIREMVIPVENIIPSFNTDNSMNLMDPMDYSDYVNSVNAANNASANNATTNATTNASNNASANNATTNATTNENTRHPLIQTLGNALHTFIQNEVENNGYMNEFMYTFDIPLFDISGNQNTL